MLHPLHDSQNEMSKMSNVEAPDAAATCQDDTPMSEMDKAAVLTLIREEVQHATMLFLLYEPAKDRTFFFYSSPLTSRSSLKRLRSTNGRGSMRRPERKFLRWGRIVLFFPPLLLHIYKFMGNAGIWKHWKFVRSDKTVFLSSSQENCCRIRENSRANDR